MRFNARQATWVFAISSALLAAPGFVHGQPAQDDHGRGQDNRHDDQRNVPPGGYAQTCQDIRTNGNTLEARCQTRDGNWNRTSLPDFNQCASEIENDDGRLVCNKRANNEQGDRHDNGQGDRRDNGQEGDRRDNGRADRHDGDRHDEDRNAVPSGGYQQTCHDIQVVGTTLQANCQKKNGKWRQASLRNFNRCTDQIENNNGKLVCSR